MFSIKTGCAVLAIGLTMAVPMSANAQQRGKVLVVMSSAQQLDLRDGKQYQTGFYLNEFAVPYRKLVDAGYQPVIANPNGDRPAMDKISNNAMFFGGDDKTRGDALNFVESLEQLKKPKTLAAVLSEGVDGYVGLFIPGGHAPMSDLIKNKNLGQILSSFHQSKRPTGIICHGPIVLLSAMQDPDSFIDAMISNDGSANAKAQNWPYVGYRVTVFSTGEEQALEGPKGLGGYVQFYPVNALAEAGARIETVANWHSNVVVDRELISPATDVAN